MILKIKTGKPDWSAVNHGKEVVIVEFPNCVSTSTNKSFKWVPRYDKLIRIKEHLDKAEEVWKNHNITQKGGNQNGNKQQRTKFGQLE